MKLLHKYYFYFFIFYLSFSISFAQGTKDKSSFPASWEGDWYGNLIIHQAGKDSVQTVPMELNIHPMDSSDNWQWQLVYIVNGEKAPRDYELMIVDENKGHYAVDEKNAIVLDSYLLGQTLTSRFSVQNSLLITIYRKEGETLLFEILAGSLEDTTQTGGEEDIPEVFSYPVGMRQIARLRRR